MTTKLGTYLLFTYTINTDLFTLQQPTQQEAATRSVSDQRNAIFSITEHKIVQTTRIFSHTFSVS